jgi:serine/threonine protein kinase
MRTGSARLGAYEILGEIGRGGMGAVYRARSADGREVALKVLLQDDAESAAAFEREQRLLASFTLAEGFVPLLDSGSQGKKRWVVMPLLRGGTLRDRLKRGPLEEEETVALVRKLATALGRAHERGIVHRDMKPENVLFTEKGEPLVADLGLAKHFRRDVLGASQSRSLSASGTIVGTAGYMAPEQLQESRDAGPPCDVFALGVIFHECLAGARPFRGGVLEYARALESPPERLPRGTARWIEKTVARMLSYKADARFADGHAVARALARPPRRGRTALVAAGLLLLLLGVGGALIFARGKTGPPAPTPASPKPAPRTTPPPAPPAPGDARALVERGAEEIRRGELDQLIEDATHALESQPDLVAALLLRAEARKLKGDAEGAVADASRVIELEPRRADGWRIRGSIRSRNRDFRGALSDLDRAIELDPNDAMSLSDRASARYLTSDAAGALADANRAIELAPNLAEPWAIRADLRARSRDTEGALEDATRAIELAPENMMPWRARGVARLQRGETQEALRDLTRALELGPEDSECLRLRGQARVLLHDRPGARADFEHYLRVAPPGDSELSRIRTWLEENAR